MQTYLNDVTTELEQLLETCQLKYKKNEETLAKIVKTKTEPKRYTTYYFCGYPYFKDRSGCGPSQPAEYLKRKVDELFPLDLEKRGIWLPRDKVELIQGVKKQTIKYLQSKNRDRIRQTASKRCANELTSRIDNGLLLTVLFSRRFFFLKEIINQNCFFFQFSRDFRFRIDAFERIAEKNRRNRFSDKLAKSFNGRFTRSTHTQRMYGVC